MEPQRHDPDRDTTFGELWRGVLMILALVALFVVAGYLFVSYL
jgi:hypothetical protein